MVIVLGSSKGVAGNGGRLSAFALTPPLAWINFLLPLYLCQGTPPLISLASPLPKGQESPLGPHSFPSFADLCA